MKNTVSNENKLEDLLEIVRRLKKELNDSYSMLKTNFNPIKNIDIFDDKRKILKEIAEKIKEFGAATGGNEEISVEEGVRGGQAIKELLKAEIQEIAELNSAFSALIKKNIYYNQLTISFITDAFNKNSIYDRAGGSNSNFFPLKNVLMKSGVRV
jgi:benzoyl-CoA reductase/2-hydroxyglutaryl-CoA dehydratase subunit BcrC/BadD/HgdB